MWDCFCCAGRPAMSIEMKVMGIGQLEHCADAVPSEAGAVAALLAELRAGVWRCWGDVARQYPSSRIDGQVLEVRAAGRCLVRMLVSLEAGCVLILSAGPGEGT